MTQARAKAFRPDIFRQRGYAPFALHKNYCPAGKRFLCRAEESLRFPPMQFPCSQPSAINADSRRKMTRGQRKPAAHAVV